MARSKFRDRNQIENVLKNWELDSFEIGEQFNEGTEKLIFRVKTHSQDFLLKGQPWGIPEATVKSNVRAHLFLGNENGMTPGLYPTKTGEFYISNQGYWFYLMEFIDGRKMEETPEDEYKIGQAARKLHELQGYDVKSPFTQSKEHFYTWFRKHSFVKEFDALLDALPDFEMLDQCFVHTDIGPHNTMLRQDGEVVFIDLDDAGIGSRYLDLGWPFIMQFVDFNHNTEEMNYRFDLAQSFLRGYFGEGKISRKEYDLLFQGAIQMHISYMQVYGPYAVDSLWKILQFGIEQKEILWEMIEQNNC
ncbi:MAG: aminoglycoside phosphotransferase family protein [Lachnospiraceae bacterium]|nr:aminoglycoside phosphotransferase family protein [Lachnospiraceae bacterium]